MELDRDQIDDNIQLIDVWEHHKNGFTGANWINRRQKRQKPSVHT